MGELIVLDGCTFFISDETGDTNSDPHEGFFIEDVRTSPSGSSSSTESRSTS